MQEGLQNVDTLDQLCTLSECTQLLKEYIRTDQKSIQLTVIVFTFVKHVFFSWEVCYYVIQKVFVY